MSVAKKNGNGGGKTQEKEGLVEQPPLVENIIEGEENSAGFQGCGNVVEGAGLAEGRRLRSCKRKLEGVVGDGEQQGEKRTRRKMV